MVIKQDDDGAQTENENKRSKVTRFITVFFFLLQKTFSHQLWDVFSCFLVCSLSILFSSKLLSGFLIAILVFEIIFISQKPKQISKNLSVILWRGFIQSCIPKISHSFPLVVSKEFLNQNKTKWPLALSRLTFDLSFLVCILAPQYLVSIYSLKSQLLVVLELLKTATILIVAMCHHP